MSLIEGAGKWTNLHKPRMHVSRATTNSAFSISPDLSVSNNWNMNCNLSSYSSSLNIVFKLIHLITKTANDS